MKEKNKSIYALDAMLLENCTTKEQEKQMLRIIHNRKQKKNYVFNPLQKTHSYKTI